MRALGERARVAAADPMWRRLLWLVARPSQTVAAPLLGAGVGAVLALALNDDDSSSPRGQNARTAELGSAEQVDEAEARVEEVLDKTDQELRSATARVSGLKSEGASPTTMDEFLTSVFDRVARYWRRTLPAGDYPEVSAKFVWVGVGEQVTTPCENLDGSPVVADDGAAFYCPRDDTMYVAQKLAVEVWLGIRADFGAGARAGYAPPSGTSASPTS